MSDSGTRRLHTDDIMALLCQESFIVRSAKEVLKKDVQRQQSKMGSFKLKGGSFSLKRPATTGTQGAPRMPSSCHGIWLENSQDLRGWPASTCLTVLTRYSRAESLRKVMMNQKLRELAKVAGTTAYMAQQAGVKTSNLPENPGQSPVTDEPWPQPRKVGPSVPALSGCLVASQLTYIGFGKGSRCMTMRTEICCR